MEPREYELMDAAEERMWWYRALHARIMRALVPVTGAVLDVGCGTGGMLARVRAARPDLRLTGLEWWEPAALRAARKSAVPVVRGSANALPFADGRFAAAVLADVLCHEAVRPEQALSECARVLAPNGRLIVNMPAFASLFSAHDRRVRNARRQNARELKMMLTRAGFRDVRAHYWNGLLLPLMIAHRKIRGRHGDAPSDVAVFSPPVDATLFAVTALERHLPFALPAGSSVLATAIRP
ncbi:MAG: class I SAM-dependent methyltransferase [Acidisphaera sp.]|nr:class I SAM-dependent methyltransferase [Acidisphaera sp.]MBV9811134.1 class I SAM-dependent methyltransferase [Acetobacteraceae bacterium]